MLYSYYLLYDFKRLSNKSAYLNDFWMYKSNHLTITRAFISAFPKLRSWKHAICFRCILSCIPRVAQSRNALLGRNASCRNNCPHPSLGTQLKEIQMVCNLSSPPLLLWMKERARWGLGVFDLGKLMGQWRVGTSTHPQNTNKISLMLHNQIKMDQNMWEKVQGSVIVSQI